MSLKPITPKNRRPARAARPAPMPVVIVPKKSSGGSGWLVILLIVALLGGGWFVYNNQQKNEAAIAARDARAEENRRKVEEEERKRLEAEQARNRSHGPEVTAMGTAVEEETPVSTPVSSASVSIESEEDSTPAEEEQEEGESSALGSTALSASGGYAETDTSAPRFDLTAKGSKGKKVSKELAAAIDEASRGDTFHDLQSDLKRSFAVACPELFADESTIPPYPAKEEKTLRLAQGIYVCLNVAAEVAARDENEEEPKHARFVNWLLADKAKAARTFTYGLEHYEVTDMATAADLMGKLREAYIKNPAEAQKKIPTILKKAAK